MTPDCRSRLTAEDFQFLQETLATNEADSVTLQDLLTDPGTRDAILDHDKVYQQIVDRVGCLKVSSALYFYVMTRRALQKAALDERDLADYVATVLETFGDQRKLFLSLRQKGLPPAVSHGFPYMSDILMELTHASHSQAYFLRTHMGDSALFLSGLFAERIRAQRERRGAPDIDFYEKVGQSSYRIASKDREAKTAKVSHLLEVLAGRFHEIRLALNELRETVFHLSDPPQNIITA